MVGAHDDGPVQARRVEAEEPRYHASCRPLDRDGGSRGHEHRDTARERGHQEDGAEHHRAREVAGDPASSQQDRDEIPQCDAKGCTDAEPQQDEPPRLEPADAAQHPFRRDDGDDGADRVDEDSLTHKEIAQAPGHGQA